MPKIGHSINIFTFFAECLEYMNSSVKIFVGRIGRIFVIVIYILGNAQF